MKRISDLREQLKSRITAAGGKVPPQQEWEDYVDYNNTLLETAEQLEQRK